MPDGAAPSDATTPPSVTTPQPTNHVPDTPNVPVTSNTPESSPNVAPATAFAATLLVEAVRRGVQDLVLCPGSRSQAFALVAAELETSDRVRLHVRHDERSAGFFALGLARELERPVPVITTSGTAVANLHPAMLEAFHAGVALVALTADRPDELVGVGANQATVQPGMFGARIECRDVPAPTGRVSDRSVAQELGLAIATATAPMHVNVAFRDPLSSALPDLELLFAEQPAGVPAAPAAGVPDARGAAGAHDATGARSPTDSIHQIAPSDGVPTIVVAGDRAGKAAEAAAHEGGWPLVAEASSGARFGRNLVVAYRELLGAHSPHPELRDGVARVLVFGHPTLSRQVPALVARDDVEVIVVGRTGGEPFGAPGDVAVRTDRVEIVRGTGYEDARRTWLRSWVRASHAIVDAASSDPAAPDPEASTSTVLAERGSFARGELAVARERVDRNMLVDAIWRSTWPHDRLVLGSSRLVRVLDGRVPGKPLRVHANRGLAGIDGTVATALGVATGSQHALPSAESVQGSETISAAAAAGITRVLLGDLAFLHDAGSLLVGQGGEHAPRVQVIVGNDGGGTIFDGLEVANVSERAAMDRVLYTPHEADLGAIAAAYGWHHERVTTRAALEAALTSRTHDRVVIEVPIDR